MKPSTNYELGAAPLLWLKRAVGSRPPPRHPACVTRAIVRHQVHDSRLLELVSQNGTAKARM